MPTYVTESARRLPVYGAYDLVVAGGGPAGVAAAVSGARNGLKVLLLEQIGCLGGMSTGGLVPCLAPYSQGATAPLIRGIAGEILSRLKAAGGNGEPGVEQWPAIDAEKLKLIYDDLVNRAGVTTLFFTFVSAVLRERGRIRGLVIENKGGRQVVLGKAFVDATGDGDVAARSGVRFVKGDSKGRMMGVTLCFTVAGIDPDGYRRWLRKFPDNVGKNRFLREAVAAGRLPDWDDAEHRMIADIALQPGYRAYNYGHVFNVDGTNPDDLARAMMRGREIAHSFMALARRYIPGMKNAVLTATALLPGVRETRRIRGVDALDERLFRSGRITDDAIAVYDYPVDLHGSDKKAKTVLEEQPAGFLYGIPYRIMVPAGGPANLLVAGRCVSADRIGQSSVRTMPACFAMGEAAGVAARFAVRQGVPFGAVDPAALRQVLAKQGANIPSVR